MADDIIQDNFIEIPSYLTEGIKDEITTNSIGLDCTGCLDFCEVYDECCQYENCQGTCQTCLGCEGGCQSCQTTCEDSCQTCLTSQNPAIGAVLTISDIDRTYLTATVSGLNPNGTALNIEFYANNVFKKGIMTSSATEVSTFIEGLSSNTTYTIKAEIYNLNTSTLLKTLSKTITTDGNPKLPTPTLDTSKTVKTATSITVSVNPVSGADYYYFRINGGATINNGVIATHAFTNLTPNTQYYIEIKVGGSGYEDSNWAGYYATTLATTAWEWWYPKDDIRRFTLDRDEWLAFCNKINEVRVAKGLSAYSFTTSSTYIGKDKPFYAWVWLEAANAINAINGQVAAACLNVKSWSESQDNDSIIYPWYWDNLKSALNNAI